MQKVLFLAHRVPCPPDKGDRIRSYHMLRCLSARARIHLGFLTDELTPAATTRELDSICERVFVGRIPRWKRWQQAGTSLVTGGSITEAWFYSAPFQAEVDRLVRTNDYDAVICYSSSTLQYVEKHKLADRLIVDLIDVDSQKWHDYARHSSLPLAWVFRREAELVRRIEQRASASRAVALTTSREAELYRQQNPYAAVQVINNGIELADFSPRQDVERQGCVFVGYLDYRANVIGLQWFCENVWRELVRIHPGATFSIVGRNATREVRRLGSIPGVEVVGAVSDVRPLIAGTNIVVVPLLVARGIQNKILEAMAMGKAVVASPAALAGIAARQGKEIIEADAPGEWISRVVDLWGDAQRRRQIGEQARRFVETHHDWRHCLAPLVNMCSGRRGVEKRAASDFCTRPRLAGVIG